MRRLAVPLALALSLDAAHAATLDNFEDLAPWSVESSEGVKASLYQIEGKEGRALCIDYDFGNVSGYAVARRKLPLQYPANYVITANVKGDGPPNALQLKLVDASGENVWWSNRPDFPFTTDWQLLRVRKRDLSFAWGPAKDRELTRTASIEFAIARGEGGHGFACFDRLALSELPVPAATYPNPVVTQRVARSFTLDLGVFREFGGLVMRWEGPHASRFDVELSEDGARWESVRHVDGARSATNALFMPDAQARFIRVKTTEENLGFADIAVRDLAFGASPNAFFESLAREAPRGGYPRGFSGQQPYWTVVGVDGGTAQGLLSEDGALESGAGKAAIEPLLIADGKVLTWAGAEIRQSLAQAYLPIPTVAWNAQGLAMRVTAFAMGSRAASQVVTRYTVENRADRGRTVTLALAARPFQVNPPGQFLNAPGGVAKVHAIVWDGNALTIDGEPRVHPLVKPDEAFAVPFDAGNLVDILAGNTQGFAPFVVDPTGFASAALLFRLEIPAGGSRSVAIVTPLAGNVALPDRDPMQWVENQERAVAAAWSQQLNRVKLTLPAAGQPLADTVRTALAHILISRNGPALQPGTRSYARSWIRDGAMMSETLLRMDHPAEVREFADWFAPHLYAKGNVPCCADRRGADPVPENDSHGEWAFLVGEYFRYTQDAQWARDKWPGVAKAIRYMETQRATSTSREYRGLLPPTISHEGYSDKPAWSYWDDFWGLAGYRSAAELAASLGQNDEARAIAKQRDGFQRDVRATLVSAMARHKIDYIPGSADRGDFDATSTTIALTPARQLAELPRAWFDATFERYWKEFAARRDGGKDWDAYTPYEWRNVGAFVRLGWRDRATGAFDFFMRDRRPAGWNQWAEVVGRDARKPRFVGDMPHGWVASDFIAAALDLFAYERASGQKMVLASGMPLEWLDGNGIAIEGLRTPWGRLDYAFKREGSRYVLDVGKDTAIPPGGLVLRWLCDLRVTEAPAHVVVETPCAD